MVDNKAIELYNVLYDNSLSIANEGKLPPEIRLADLKREHLSKPRNKLLADIFYKAGFIESWGRGTLKIFRECKRAHIPEPNFYEDHGVVKVIFELAGSSAEFQNEGVNERQARILEKTVEKTVEKIIALIKDNPKITQAELAKETELSRRGIEWNLKQLKLKGVICCIGSAKGGYWEVIKE